jgi:hypothetical protein
VEEFCISRGLFMLLHLGGDDIVFQKDIIAIMDLESTQMSKDTKLFLKRAQEEGIIKNISQEEPKSYIITKINDKNIIYYSHISSSTLLKRMDLK